MRLALLSLFCILPIACTAPSGSTCPPPYADLAGWGPPPVQLVEECGVAVGAIVRAEVGSSRLLYGVSFNEPGEGIYVQAKLRRLEGVGKLLALLWNGDDVLAVSGPADDDSVTLLGIATTEETQVHFIGQTTGIEPLTFEVRDVLIEALEIKR